MDNADINEEQANGKALAKVFKGGGILLLGTLLTKVFGFLWQLIIIRILSPELYGLYALALSMITIAASLSYSGLHQGAQRFIAFYRAREDPPMVKGSILSSIKITILLSVFFTTALVLLAQPISNLFKEPDLGDLLYVFCPAVILTMLLKMLNSYFLGFQRPGIVVWLSEVLFGVVSVTLLFILLSVNKSIYSAIIAFLLSSLILSIILLSTYWRLIGSALKNVNPRPMYKSLLFFSLPLLFTAILSLIMANIDTIMIGYYMAADNVGFYNAAFLLMHFIPIFLQPIGDYFMVIATGLVADGSREQLRDLYGSVTKWIFIFTVPLFLTFFLFPSAVLTMLFGSSYAEAAVSLAILVSAEFINVILGPNNRLLVAFGKTKFIMISSVSACVLNIILNVFLIPKFGISGAAIATASSLGVVNVINSAYLYFKFSIHPFGRTYILPVLLLITSSAFLYYPLSRMVAYSSWLSLCCYPIFLALGFLFIFITKSYSENDRLILESIKRKILKLGRKG